MRGEVAFTGSVGDVFVLRIERWMIWAFLYAVVLEGLDFASGP